LLGASRRTSPSRQARSWQATCRENALSDPSSGSKSKGTKAKTAGSFFVYILRCADGTLYTGSAKDPQARAKAHNDGRGARYTSGRRPVSLVYAEKCDSQGSAVQREHQLKRWTRRKKEALIVGDLGLLKRL